MRDKRVTTTPPTHVGRIGIFTSEQANVFTLERCSSGALIDCWSVRRDIPKKRLPEEFHTEVLTKPPPNGFVNTIRTEEGYAAMHQKRRGDDCTTFTVIWDYSRLQACNHVEKNSLETKGKFGCNEENEPVTTKRTARSRDSGPHGQSRNLTTTSGLMAQRRRNPRKTRPLNQPIKETNPDPKARRKRPNHNRIITHKTVELNTPNEPNRHKRLTPATKLGEQTNKQNGSESLPRRGTPHKSRSINTSTLTLSISRYDKKNCTVTGLWATWTIKKPNDNQRTNGPKKKKPTKNKTTESTNQGNQSRPQSKKKTTESQQNNHPQNC
ncbi:hypothetical protein CLF_107544 [Clonorchis sinensis]|uniref:Uncharacterized protein n=1 Tax=Clonorchis sinensis TaxID=79923 RepID=G7YQR9_CLOSI|nr:hypothetical protein CLF_107544 [Clonorchis sinensis]